MRLSGGAPGRATKAGKGTIENMNHTTTFVLANECESRIPGEGCLLPIPRLNPGSDGLDGPPSAGEPRGIEVRHPPVLGRLRVEATSEQRRRIRNSRAVDRATCLYLREVAGVRKLTPKAEIDLIRRWRKGDQKARTHLVESNLDLVVTLARGQKGQGLPLIDLISEGNIGLLLAIARFNPAEGGIFSAYASWWILHVIGRALGRQPRRLANGSRLLRIRPRRSQALAAGTSTARRGRRSGTSGVERRDHGESGVGARHRSRALRELAVC
jgi:hypothetical protein